MNLFKRLWPAASSADRSAAQRFDPERPVAAETPPDAPDRRLRKRLNAQHGLSALIIDDSPTIVAALGKTLRSAGYVTLEAADAESGLLMAKQTKPSVIFLDIVLPGMNGFAALRLIRKHAETQAIPVIMISGNEHATEQFYANRIGADDFMKKPFSRLEVFSRIESLLDVNLIPRRKGWVPPATSVSRPLSRQFSKSAAAKAARAAPPATPAPAPAAVAPPVALAAPLAVVAAAPEPPLIPPAMSALDARKELNAMGLQYFDQEQYNAATRRGDALAIALFIRGGGILANPAEASPSLLALAQSKGQAALAAVRKQANE